MKHLRPCLVLTCATALVSCDGTQTSNTTEVASNEVTTVQL